MEREELEQMIDEGLAKLKKMQPGTQEHSDTLKAVERLVELLEKDYDMEAKRLARNTEQDLKERELDLRERELGARIKSDKRNTFWGVVGKILGIVGGGATILLLRNVKDDQGIVDKDEFALAKGAQPRN